METRKEQRECDKRVKPTDTTTVQQREIRLLFGPWLLTKVVYPSLLLEGGSVPATTELLHDNRAGRSSGFRV